MERLTVLYDGSCAFCHRCRDWLADQRAYLPLEFLAIQSPQVGRRFHGVADTVEGDAPKELIVISNKGGVYRGSDAFLMCLYALEEYRELSIALADPMLKPMARRAFRRLRDQVSNVFDTTPCSRR